MTDNWEDFRTEQGGGKGISFGGVGDRSQIGVIKGGRVIDVKEKQPIRDFKPPHELKKTKSGKQLYQLPVLVATNERAHPEDDGQRTLYVKGLMFDAIDEALKAAGASTVEIGGELLIAYVGDRKVGDGEMRSFKAKYTPAPPQAAQNQAGVWGGQQAQAPQQPAADPFAGGQQQGPPPQQPHPSQVFAAAGGPPQQGWPNQQQAPAAAQADPFASQQPPPHGHVNQDPQYAAWLASQQAQQPVPGPPLGSTPAADPWAQQQPVPGPPPQGGTLQDQWAAAGQPPPAVDPWA